MRDVAEPAARLVIMRDGSEVSIDLTKRQLDSVVETLTCIGKDRAVTSSEIALMRSRAADGWPVKMIASELRRSYQCVYTYVRDLITTKRPHSTHEERERARKLRAQGHPVNVIAQVMGRSENSITRWTDGGRQ